jgi:outer membrane protein TolC
MKNFIVYVLVLLSVSTLSQASEPLRLSLSSAMALAAKQNPQVFAANERVRQSIANIAMNRSALLPQVSGIFGGQRQTTDLRASGINLPGDPHVGPFNSFDTRARLTMDILDPQAIERLKSAKAGAKLSNAELRKVKEDILALVGEMFLEAQRADQAIALNQINLKKAQHHYDLVVLRLHQGTSSTFDLDQAKVDLAQAEYLLKAAQFHAEQTRLDLASALNLPLDQSIIFEEDNNWMNKPFPSSGTSPQVDVAQAQLDYALGHVNEARAGFLPKLTASGDYGRLGESPSASSNTYMLGMGVSLPIWEGGLKQAQLDAAKSQYEESKALLKDAKNQNQVKITEAINNFVQANAFLALKADQWTSAQHQWDIVSSRLHSGLASQMDLDEVEAIRAQAIDERNEAQALMWTARINEAHAMGQLEDLFKGK